jgi:hypothetical protein
VATRDQLSDLCAGGTEIELARGRILAWLAEGAREVSWALCSMPRERWTTSPPDWLGAWPVLRHARALALREAPLTLPAVRWVLGDQTGEVPSRRVFEQVESAWDAGTAADSADALLRALGETRFELLQRLECAPDWLWSTSLPIDTSPQGLDTLLLQARQHELEHLAAMWRLALYWDRGSPAATFRQVQEERMVGLPLLLADRLEESH